MSDDYYVICCKSNPVLQEGASDLVAEFGSRFYIAGYAYWDYLYHLHLLIGGPRKTKRAVLRRFCNQILVLG